MDKKNGQFQIMDKKKWTNDKNGHIMDKLWPLMDLMEITVLGIGKGSTPCIVIIALQIHPSVSTKSRHRAAITAIQFIIPSM